MTRNYSIIFRHTLGEMNAEKLKISKTLKINWICCIEVLMVFSPSNPLHTDQSVIDAWVSMIKHRTEFYWLRKEHANMYHNKSTIELKIHEKGCFIFVGNFHPNTSHGSARNFSPGAYHRHLKEYKQKKKVLWVSSRNALENFIKLFP